MKKGIKKILDMTIYYIGITGWNSMQTTEGIVNIY
jgi:hypothetical protein